MIDGAMMCPHCKQNAITRDGKMVNHSFHGELCPGSPDYRPTADTANVNDPTLKRLLSEDRAPTTRDRILKALELVREAILCQPENIARFEHDAEFSDGVRIKIEVRQK